MSDGLSWSLEWRANQGLTGKVKVCLTLVTFPSELARTVHAPTRLGFQHVGSPLDHVNWIVGPTLFFIIIFYFKKIILYYVICMVLAGPHSSLYGWIYDIINLFIFCPLVLLGSSSLDSWDFYRFGHIGEYCKVKSKGFY